MAKKNTDIESPAEPKKSRTPRTAGKAPHTRKNSLRGIREGRVLSIESFRQHAWFILIVVVVMLSLIGQRYTNQSKMREIKKLDRELALRESELVSRKAAYMSLIRENEMRRLLRERNLDLDYQEKPPYVINP